MAISGRHVLRRYLEDDTAALPLARLAADVSAQVRRAEDVAALVQGDAADR